MHEAPRFNTKDASEADTTDKASQLAEAAPAAETFTGSPFEDRQVAEKLAQGFAEIWNRAAAAPTSDTSPLGPEASEKIARAYRRMGGGEGE